MKVTSIRPTKAFPIPQDLTQTAQIVVRSISPLDMQSHENYLANFKQSRVENGGTTEIVLHYNTGNTKRMFVEVYLAAAEIIGIFDDNENSLFRSSSNPRTGGMQVSNAMTYEEFCSAVSQLPIDVIQSMHDFVLEVNPIWDPNAEKK